MTGKARNTIADETLLMFGGSRFICGRSGDVLTETSLRDLYGSDLRRLQFEHNGRVHETLVPVLPNNEQFSARLSDSGDHRD